MRTARQPRCAAGAHGAAAALCGGRARRGSRDKCRGRAQRRGGGALTSPLPAVPQLDDWGWANFGAHNANPEVQTPHLDALLAGGIDLQRHYVHKFCSPSRCALQSGRSPIHVNVLNNDMRNYNANDAVSGYQGIPPNMTTIAAKLKGVGYQTHAVGKWNAGMARKSMTPHGRGYDSGLTCALAARARNRVARAARRCDAYAPTLRAPPPLYRFRL